MSEVFATVHWDPAAVDEDHDRCPVCASGLLTDPEAYGRALATRVYERLVSGTASPAPATGQTRTRNASATAKRKSRASGSRS